MRPRSGSWCLPALSRLVVLLALCCTPVLAAPAPQPQDLAAVASRLSLLGHMLAFEETAGAPMRPAEVLAAGNWVAGSHETLAAPRRPTTIWLLGALRNSSAAPVVRWLEVAPRRLAEVQLFLLEPGGTVPAAHQRGGLAAPPDQREVHTSRTVFPIMLAPGETRQLLLRLRSDSLPYVAVDLWKPLPFHEQDARERVLHGALLACVLTLLMVLLLKMDGRFALLGAWIAMAYALEAEREGYITQMVLSTWAEYGVFMRAAFAVLTYTLFLLASLLILELWQHRWWRRIHLWLTGIFLLVMACLPFVEPNMARRMAMLVAATALTVWPLTLPWLHLKGQPWRQALLLMFALNWGVSLSLTVAYIMNIGYTGQFTTSSVVIKIGVILGIIGLFALQEKRREQARQRASLEGERERSARLEAAVAARTDELRKALLDANEANRAKTEFFARVSHDLRSPLTAIIGYTELLLQAEGGRIGHKARIILRSAGHMLKLVNDLIEHARGVSSNRLEIAPVYIHDLLDALALEAKILAEKKSNRFRLDIRDELPPVLRADGKRLHQVLLNLLDNAAKFTEGGTIELQVSCRIPPGDTGRVWLELQIRDSGRGIAQQDRTRAFEPFFRADGQASKGWGLGLVIVEEWVKRMNGELRLHSALGEGTEVSIRLPLEIGREDEMNLPQLVDACPSLPALWGGGRHVWVVEDVAEIRGLLIEEFGSAGFVVHSAGDGRDFIERIRHPESVRPALVLTDDLMPHAEGAAVLAAVREHWPGVPVMLLSATRKTMRSFGMGTEQGFDASLTKPVNLGVLRGTVARLLALAPEPAGAGQAGGGGQSAAAMVLPPPAELVRFDELLRMGAVTDLRDWAAALCGDASPCRAFALRVVELAEAGDLDAIERLHASHGIHAGSAHPSAAG